MGELRIRMIRDMTVRGFAARTHHAYIAAVVRLAKHYRRSPDQITDDEVQTYLAYLIQERRLSWSTCSQAANAFRGFLANRARHDKLARGRALLAPPVTTPPCKVESVHALMLRLTGLDIDQCPRCRDGRLRVIQILPPTDGAAVPITDSS